MSYKTLSSDKVSDIVNRMGIYMPTQELEAFVNTMDDVAGANKDAVEGLVQRAEMSASEAQQDADAALASAQVAANEANKAKDSADLAEQARLLGANIGFATKADMDSSLAHPEGTLALVTNDDTADNNVIYRKTGASGSGSWVQSAARVTGLEGQVVVLYAPTVLNLNHANRFLRINVGAAVNITIPPQSSVAWPDGCQIEGVQLGEGGSVTFVAGAGVTLEWDKRWALKTAAPGAVFGLKRLSVDRWLVFGALGAA